MTPRESSSGHRRCLGRISEQGEPYVRMLLVHGARAVLGRAKQPAEVPDRQLRHLQRWALQLEARVRRNKAAVGRANKLARISWAIWLHQRDFNANHGALNAR